MNSLAWLRFKFWLNRFHTLPRAQAQLHATEAPYVERRLFGAKFAANVGRSATHKLLYLEGERFVEERFLIKSLLKPGMTVVDVGANIGYYLMMFEQAVGKHGYVICIEPSEENLPELETNIKINGFGNVALHKVAIGMEEGSIGLRRGINSGITPLDKGTYQVPLKRLDTLVTGKVDFLKIDVEGYEGQVLQGAMDLLKRDLPTLFLELHPHIIPEFNFSTRGIVDDLVAVYGGVELYERAPETSLVQKVALRYLDRNPLKRVPDVDAYIERYSSSREPHTFWAVFHQPSTLVR